MKNDIILIFCAIFAISCSGSKQAVFECGCYDAQTDSSFYDNSMEFGLNVDCDDVDEGSSAPCNCKTEIYIENSSADGSISNDAGTVDAASDSGVDAGEICTCWENSFCCDGCHPINEGKACDDGDPGTLYDHCSLGECFVTLCECLTICCDGCVSANRDGDSCDDLNPNTINDVCVGKACIGEPMEDAGI